MENQSRFERAYNALVESYFGGTLAKGTCHACAVGNIVAAGQKGKVMVIKDDDNIINYECTTDNAFWSDLFMTLHRHKYQSVFIEEHPELAQKLEEVTGYTAGELAKVEYAYESNTKIRFEDYSTTGEQEILEDQFKGLEAAVDVLLKIEGMTDNGHIQKFRKHPRLQLV